MLKHNISSRKSHLYFRLVDITGIFDHFRNMAHRIVITGAPASGKTTFVEKLKSEPFLSDFTIFDELARQLLLQKHDYRDHWDQFHLDIYKQQIERENNLGGRPFISDRGTVDAFAFHPSTMTEVKTTLEIEYQRYDHVIQLGSSAALGEEFYQIDTIRNEPIEHALKIENSLKKFWGDHPGYIFLDAEPDLEKKYQKLTKILSSLVLGL